MITEISKLYFFFSLTNKYTIPLSAHGYFFPLPFSGFSSKSNPHSEDLYSSWKNEVPQSIIYMDCYFSQEHHKTA